MQPVSDQRRRADLAADPDPVPGDQLVAGEPDHRRHRHRDQIGHRARMGQPGHRLIGRQRRGRRDDRDNHHPGQVLGAAIPVGVAAVRRAPAHHERNSQRHRGQRVGRVMQRVAQQRHRARHPYHHRLEHRGGTEHGQREPQRPDTLRIGLHRRIHLVGGVMRMRAQQVPQTRHHTQPMRTTMTVAMLVIVDVARAMAVATSAA
jgi:hypothetical protein